MARWCDTQLFMVPYEIRIKLNPLFQRASTRRLEAWHKVAKKSGLFRDPRCMILLRSHLQERGI